MQPFFPFREGDVRRLQQATTPLVDTTFYLLESTDIVQEFKLETRHPHFHHQSDPPPPPSAHSLLQQRRAVTSAPPTRLPISVF